MVSKKIKKLVEKIMVYKLFSKPEKPTTVVNIKKSKFDIYIGRPSKWGNPFKTGPLDKRLLYYENYLLNNDELLNSLPELRGKVLGCHCDPKPCHGHILAYYADLPPEELERVLTSVRDHFQEILYRNPI
ncbi:MAG: hypothetical protein KatS3mg087_1395 [Patescibacteria group bacterium]|nr:MAG: hypothetical protein KatS3mg087_1395 [Patescibacteria group bacterium]